MFKLDSRMLPAVPSPGDAEKLDESLISQLCDARYGTTKTSAIRKKRSNIQVLPGKNVSGVTNIISEDFEPPMLRMMR